VLSYIDSELESKIHKIVDDKIVALQQEFRAVIESNGRALQERLDSFHKSFEDEAASVAVKILDEYKHAMQLLEGRR
jgi:hypothetical protein